MCLCQQMTSRDARNLIPNIFPQKPLTMAQQMEQSLQLHATRIFVQTTDINSSLIFLHLGLLEAIYRCGVIVWGNS